MASLALAFDILARDKASAVFDKVGRKVDDTGTRASKFKEKAGVAMAAAGVAVAAFAKSSVSAYVDAEKSQRVLTDAYSRFPAMANVSIQALRDQAAALQNKTKFDGDNINAMQGSLAAYKLTGSQIQALTPLVLDYAEKTGKDLPTATEAIGKAMLGQGRALKDVGINFKDTGSAAGNFDQLMGSLRKQVGGFAEKEGASAEGKAEILKNKFGDLQEAVGQKLLPVAEKLTDWLTKAVDWLTQNEDKAKALGIAIGALAVVLGVAKLALVAQSAAAGLHAAWTGVLAVKTGLWAAAQWVLNAAMNANPIGLVVLAVAALAAGIIWVATKTTFFQDAWKVMTDALGEAWRWLWNTILAPIIRWILEGFAKLTEGIAAFLRGLSNIPGFGWAKDAADKMDGAARKAREMAKGIKDIPKVTSVSVKILVSSQETARAQKILDMASGGRITAKLADIASYRAHGGPVAAGSPYWVGDNPDGSLNRTSELFVPDRPGTVYNQKQIAAMAGKGSGEFAPNLTINMTNGPSAKDVVREMGWGLRP